MNDAGLPVQSLFPPLPEDDEQADATKLLFFYLYNRMNQRGYVVERLQKATKANKDAVHNFIANYNRTKVGSKKSGNCSPPCRDLLTITAELLHGEA